jgi:hypothetical protein
MDGASVPDFGAQRLKLIHQAPRSQNQPNVLPAGCQDGLAHFLNRTTGEPAPCEPWIESVNARDGFASSTVKR